VDLLQHRIDDQRLAPAPAGDEVGVSAGHAVEELAKNHPGDRQLRDCESSWGRANSINLPCRSQKGGEGLFSLLRPKQCRRRHSSKSPRTTSSPAGLTRGSIIFGEHSWRKVFRRGGMAGSSPAMTRYPRDYLSHCRIVAASAAAATRQPWWQRRRTSGRKRAAHFGPIAVIPA